MAGPPLGHLSAVLAYLGLTLLYCWPLVRGLPLVAPHDAGDPLMSTWILWWNAHAMPFTDAWWNGPMFYPAMNALALSDHRAGLSLVATPLIRAGVGPLAAHNVVFILTYVLSAVAAYALVRALTGSRAAAFLGGLAFGFHPFRAEHLPHLELLASYWLPVVFLALHRWVATWKTGWLFALAGALTMLAFTSGYYFFFTALLILGWLVWFIPKGMPPGRFGALGAALLAPVVPLAPVLLHYRRAHAEMGLSRSITEIEQLSADIGGLATPPEPLGLWEAPASWYTPEGALFPGVTTLVLVGLAIWMRREETVPASRARRLRMLLLAASAVAVAIAFVPTFFGPVGFESGGLLVSVSHAYKPLSIAAACLAIWVLTSPHVVAAWQRRSVFTFYTLATVAMWAFALGPTARLAGERVLYKAPYAWLMLFPGFADAFRAPSRFAMLAALCLAVAAAVAFARLTSRAAAPMRAAALAVAAFGVAVDGWVYPFPVQAPPPSPVVPAWVPADAVILELPMGVFEDAAAIYHGTQHGRPVVNGLGGYEPPHYAVLRTALADGRFDVLDLLARSRPLAILVDSSRPDLTAGITAGTAARLLARAEGRDVLLLDASAAVGGRAAPATTPCGIRRLSTTINASALPNAVDDNRITSWMTAGPQRGGEQVTVELEDAAPVAGLVIAQGSYTTTFARALTVSVSMDGRAWRDVWSGDGARPALAAALADPRHVRVRLSFPSVPARFVRLSQTGRSTEPWAIAELQVVKEAAQ